MKDEGKGMSGEEETVGIEREVGLVWERGMRGRDGKRRTKGR